jgi:hypothetical protein
MIGLAVRSQSNWANTRSTGSFHSLATLSCGSASFRQSDPEARSTRQITDETPPASGVTHGVSPGAARPGISKARRSFCWRLRHFDESRRCRAGRHAVNVEVHGAWGSLNSGYQPLAPTDAETGRSSNPRLCRMSLAERRKLRHGLTAFV